jgi:hypothetical protein
MGRKGRGEDCLWSRDQIGSKGMRERRLGRRAKGGYRGIKVGGGRREEGGVEG